MTVQTPLDPTPSPVLPPTPPRRRGAALAVSIVTIIVGGCAILGTLASSGITAVGVLRHSDASAGSQQSPTQGVRDVEVEVSGGALRVEYGDVSEAQLDGYGAGRWTLERRDGTLRVSSPDRSFLNWADAASATLTLPRALAREGVDLAVDVTGGSLDAEGDFGDVSVQVSGGNATLTGRATALDLSVAGGSADAELAGVDTASFDLSGGNITAALSGAAPTRTTIDATAGSVDLTLPDDTYRLTGDGPGSIDSSLTTSPTASAQVDVQTALGSITLRSS